MVHEVVRERKVRAHGFSIKMAKNSKKHWPVQVLPLIKKWLCGVLDKKHSAKSPLTTNFFIIYFLLSTTFDKGLSNIKRLLPSV